MIFRKMEFNGQGNRKYRIHTRNYMFMRSETVQSMRTNAVYEADVQSADICSMKYRRAEPPYRLVFGIDHFLFERVCRRMAPEIARILYWLVSCIGSRSSIHVYQKMQELSN